MEDFSTEGLGVTLSAAQQRDCVQVDIVDDAIVDPDEIFIVNLVTNTPGTVVRAGRGTAQVTIVDNDVDVGKFT